MRFRPGPSGGRAGRGRAPEPAVARRSEWRGSGRASGRSFRPCGRGAGRWVCPVRRRCAPAWRGGTGRRSRSAAGCRRGLPRYSRASGRHGPTRRREGRPPARRIAGRVRTAGRCRGFAAPSPSRCRACRPPPSRPAPRRSTRPACRWCGRRAHRAAASRRRWPPDRSLDGSYSSVTCACVRAVRYGTRRHCCRPSSRAVHRHRGSGAGPSAGGKAARAVRAR